MRFGSPIASGLGNPNNMIAGVRQGISPSGDVLVYITAASGFGDCYYQVYANDKLVLTVWIPEGVETQARIPSSYGSRPYVAVLSVGFMNDPSYAMQPVARGMEDNCPRARLTWIWRSVSVDALDEEHTSNWVVSGLDISQTQNWPGKSTWRTLTAGLTVVGGTVAVSLSNQGTVLAAGSGAFPGTVTLAEVGDSGVTATVDCDAGTATSSSTLLLRWPASMQVLRNVTFPAVTVVATSANTMLSDQGEWIEPTDLVPATYYYAIRPVSDTGQAGTETQLGSITVLPPLPVPSDTAYVSGTADSGIEMGFSLNGPSNTFVAFVSPVDGTINTGGSGFSGFSGYSGASGAGFWYSGRGTLPSGAFSGYPGTFRTLVKSYSGAYLSKNLAGMDIVILADGSYQDPTPNASGIDPQSIVIGAGLTLHCTGSYQYQYEPFGKGYRLILAARTQAGAYDWNNPIDSQVLAVFDKAIATCNFAYTFGSSGTYYIACRAVTALGTMGPVSDEHFIQVSNESLGVTGTLEQARG